MIYSVVFLFDTRLENVLLQQRTQRAFVGKWNGVGGKALPDEAGMHCAIREVSEEVGVQLDFMGIHKVMAITLPPEEDASGNPGDCILNFYSAIVDYNAPKKMPGEDAPFKWFPVAKVLGEGVSSPFLAGKGDIPYVVNCAYQYYKSRKR